MNTEQQDIDLAVKISKLLDESTTQLDADTSAKLLAVRKEALAHLNESPAHSWAPDWVLAGVERLGSPFGGNWRLGIAVLALATAVAGAMIWQGLQSQGSEIAEIDEGLLTDDLPISAYLDKGFDSWAKRYSR